MRGRLLALLVVASGLGWAETDDCWDRSWYASCEASSAYFSLGRAMAEPRPWFVEGDVVQRLSVYGHLLLGYWASSDLDNGKPDVRRAWIYESDPYLFYGYDVDFNEDWRLRQRGGMIWILCPGYHEPYRGTDDHSFTEWTYMASLKNPYVTPTMQVRLVSRLGTYVRPGLERPTAITDRFSVTPHVDLYGGSRRWNRSRYGNVLADHPLSQGLRSTQYGLKFAYDLAYGFSTYVDVVGYNVFGSGTREQVHAKHKYNKALCDACFVTVGLAWSY